MSRDTSIPKIIHYCWFGRAPLPPLALRCIASWRKFLPDYEIREWTEDNFNVNQTDYTREAYAAGKYAFVSDYARFFLLYKYGGIYFDTDVEVIRPLDEILSHGAFMGFETDAKRGRAPHGGSVAPGLGLGVNPGLGLVKTLRDYYHGRHFVFHPDIRSQETVVHITTRLLREAGLRAEPGIQTVGDIHIYPSEYFCPVNVTTGHLHITPRTLTIHHYAGTWTGGKFSLALRLKRLLPEWLIMAASGMRQRLRR